MRYFYDTEFIEDGKTIELISIGMVTEDGREYYAQNKECHFRRAGEWVRGNVFPHLLYFDGKRLRPAISAYGLPAALDTWRSRVGITCDLERFCDPAKYGKPELWGYYSAYDHVALCQLFGTMMDLPDGWPMYTRDLKQWCDALSNPRLPEQGKSEHNALSDARWNRQTWQFLTEIAIPAKA